MYRTTNLPDYTESILRLHKVLLYIPYSEITLEISN